MADIDPHMKKVGVRELRANLRALLQEAAGGQPILVESRGEVLAQIGPPPAPQRKPRVLGSMKGKIWMAPDFDEWPEDILQSFERPL